jgi:hypothetical protein
MIKTFEKVNKVKLNYRSPEEGPAISNRYGPTPPWQTGSSDGRPGAALKKPLNQPGNGKNITETIKHNGKNHTGNRGAGFIGSMW